METFAVVPAAMEGERLDKVLELLVPEAGLRGRKRLLETRGVLVDGRPRPKGYRVQAGQRIEMTPRASDLALDPQDWPGLRVVAQATGRMAALFKPSGLDTESRAGRPGPSLEAFLPGFFPERLAVLVNRLDRPVSGLVLVALSAQARDDYARLEDQGRVSKLYVALVRGRLDKEMVLDRAIDAARRKAVRVLDQADATGLRRTLVRPLPVDVGLGQTLVRVLIHKGARHQIRAHLAHAGHAVVGDDLYGPAGPGGSGPAGGIYLHHFLADLPGFRASAEPAWPEWPAWGPMAKAGDGLEP